MNKNQVRKALTRIVRIAEASEKGYATAAANIPNPGLKILFMHYAQQRALYKNEILAELHHLGVEVMPISSIPGMIHRGRINIFAFIMAEEKDKNKTVLKEIALGEKYALRVYQGVLRQELPAPILEVIQRQVEEIQKNNALVHQLLGDSGGQVFVQLVELQPESKTFIQMLNQPGTKDGIVQEIVLSDTELYQGMGATVFETVLSGVVGGALWGGLMGFLAGFGVVQTTVPGPVGIWAILELWAVTALVLMAVAAFISSGLALFIGLGTSEGGAHQYRNEAGHYHLRFLGEPDRASALPGPPEIDKLS